MEHPVVVGGRPLTATEGRISVLYVDTAPTGCSLVWTGDIWTVRHCATGQIHGRGTTEAAAVRMFVEGRA